MFRPDDVLPGVTAMPTVPVRPSARAYGAWLVALTAYAVAVFHRASLGVAAVDAQERFSAGASAISLFLVLQLAVYAALQVPVGVALDRFGSRRMILAGAVTMAAGQLVLALATDVPTAVAARVLVGAGDAMTFISVLRRDRAVVPRDDGAADHPAHRHPRPARLDRRGLPAGGAAARHLVADDVPGCGRHGGARRPPGPAGPARRAGGHGRGAAHRPRRAARPPARHVAGARHAASASTPTS